MRDGSGQGGRVSTHSRLKAAGYQIDMAQMVGVVSTHSRLKAAGHASALLAKLNILFQHTAA